MRRNLFIGILLVLLLGITVTGCKNKNGGPMERTGERIDEIADNVKEGESPLKKKGAMEKLGEDIDEATGSNKNP